MILLILAFFSVLLFIIIKKFKNRYNRSKKVYPEIKSGNISIFFDERNNVSIIPYVKDKYGAGRAISNLQTKNFPYTANQLGALIRYAMKLCEDGKPCSNQELMVKLNYPTWKEFTRDKRNISLHYREGQGILFNTTRRLSDGAYQFNRTGFDAVVKGSASDKELGETVLSLLGLCRS
ncbi:MAG: hypothetical protein N2645_07640 [Clostridia bacterium]|nr:hypothetical protein [Clostridia bacterium]